MRSKEYDVPVYLLGGIGVYMISPSVREGRLARSYNDVDVVIPRRAARKFTEAATAAGFTADKRFNSLQGDKRLLFYMDDIPMDVFVGVFEQCHMLNLETRFPRQIPSLKPEDLLLTKLQVVQITEKDLNDSVALVLDHDIGPDETHINPGAFCSVLTGDWGWYTTVTDNLEKLIEWTPHVLESGDALQVQERCKSLLNSAQEAPKSTKWKLRSKIGRRKIWYELPEDKKR